MRLNPSEFMEHAPQTEGQVHVNHEGCPEGTDRKQRLYIKRLPDNTVLAYCHHCGLSGIHKERVANIHRVKRQPVVEGKLAKDLRLPKDVLKDETRWPREAIGWLLKYGITDTEIRKYGIVYSPSLDRLLLPLYMDGNYIGWQGRSFAKDGDSPKYITTVDSNNPNGNCGVYACNIPRHTAVLVEDVLSAIRVSRRVDAIALIGSHPTSEVVNWIVNRGYKKLVIWLDNDKQVVKDTQSDLQNLLTLMGCEVELVLTSKDPKDHSDNEIKELLKL